MQKLKLLVCTLALAAASAGMAAGIYTWKDAEGHVHFGDKGAPADSRQIELAEPVTVKNDLQSVPPVQEPSVAPEMKPWEADAEAEAKKLRFGLPPERIARCEKLARQMVEFREVNLQVEERKKVGAQIMRLCPKTSYRCSTYLNQPKGNRCEAQSPTREGSLVSETIHRR